MAEHLHVLPYTGGLFDQPGGVIFKMEAVLRADTSDVRAENKAEAEKRLDRRMKEEIS